MTKPRIFVVGAGGHAKVVLDILEQQDKYRVEFLIDHDPKRKGEIVSGYPVLGTEAELDATPDRPRLAFVAIGDNRARAAIAARLRASGVDLVTAVHPGAQIARSARLGSGTVVMAGCVVNADTTIGNDVIVNTSASIDHDCVIDEGCHIAPGCRICGHVHIGTGAFLGAGTVVIPARRVGTGAVVGACSGVLEDVPEGARVAGIPARIL